MILPSYNNIRYFHICDMKYWRKREFLCKTSSVYCQTSLVVKYHTRIHLANKKKQVSHFRQTGNNLRNYWTDDFETLDVL